MYIIAGLGNIGKEYKKTRHNVGFEVIDYMIDKYSLGEGKLKGKGLCYQAVISGKKVLFVKPTTFMNLSGECIGEYVRYFDVELENCLVIHDDIEFPLGKIKIRKSGGAGTHNGMKNIICHLKSRNFPRIRVGIGNNKNMDLAEFVLGKFTEDEESVIRQSIEKAALAVQEYIENGIDSAMNKYNQKKEKVEETDA